MGPWGGEKPGTLLVWWQTLPHNMQSVRAGDSEGHTGPGVGHLAWSGGAESHTLGEEGGLYSRSP